MEFTTVTSLHFTRLIFPGLIIPSVTPTQLGDLYIFSGPPQFQVTVIHLFFEDHFKLTFQDNSYQGNSVHPHNGLECSDILRTL